MADHDAAGMTAAFESVGSQVSALLEDPTGTLSQAIHAIQQPPDLPAIADELGAAIGIAVLVVDEYARSQGADPLEFWRAWLSRTTPAVRDRWG